MKLLSSTISILILTSSYMSQYSRVSNPFTKSYEKYNYAGQNNQYPNSSGLTSILPNITTNPASYMTHHHTQSSNYPPAVTTHVNHVPTSSISGSGNSIYPSTISSTGALTIEQFILNLLKQNRPGPDVHGHLNNSVSSLNNSVSSMADQVKKCLDLCDYLPPSAVCDDSNVLYRNECESQCAGKIGSKKNLKYGMCCCSEEDFATLDDPTVIPAGKSLIRDYNRSINDPKLCITPCIYNCFGGSSVLLSAHSDFDLGGMETITSGDTDGCYI